ncbi:hypothetical protein GCM10010400_13400 [Streptomyces aculeolatus]
MVATVKPAAASSASTARLRFRCPLDRVNRLAIENLLNVVWGSPGWLLPTVGVGMLRASNKAGNESGPEISEYAGTLSGDENSGREMCCRVSVGGLRGGLVIR